MPRMRKSNYELERKPSEKSNNRNGGNPHRSVCSSVLFETMRDQPGEYALLWPYLYASNISAPENGRQFCIREPTAPKIVVSRDGCRT